ncbi:MAG: hypothetical protein WDA02_10950 [Saccharofermentanales bacterium]
MNKEITEIVVKVNNVDEYNKLYRTIKLNYDKINYLERIGKYPNYIFINFYYYTCSFFSNRKEDLNDSEVINFIITRRNYTYDKIFNINDINYILYIIKSKNFIPNYIPKGKIIRTFENFKSSNSNI